jgi:hypothetical protein
LNPQEQQICQFFIPPLKCYQPNTNLQQEFIHTTILLSISKMSLKQRILDSITDHPKIATFGIGLIITFAIELAIGMLDHNPVFAVSGDGNTNVK